MLKYFKKHKGSRSRGIWNDIPFRKSEGETNEVRSKENESLPSEVETKRSSLQSSSSFCDEILSQVDIEDDAIEGVDSCGESLGGYSWTSDDDIFRYKSRLAMSLLSIVSDPICLSYFVQYLDTRHALPPLKFYLDTENFKTAAQAHLERKQHNDGQASLESVKALHPSSEVQIHAQINGNRMNSTNLEEDKDRVPELKSYYDLSMRQPLTDDEKSQIYAETNKQIHQCNENTRNNNLNKSSNSYLGRKSDIECNKPSGAEKCMSPASVQDAIAIYQKYLIADAIQFVSLPVEILSQISLHLCTRTETQACSQNSKETEVAPTLPATCFDEAQRYVLDQLEREYLNDFLQSHFYSKYCVELIENGQPELSIYDILYSEATLFFFMEFLEQHGERECLDFWTSAINFRKSFEASVEDTEIENDKLELRKSLESEAQTDAMIIYEKFFSLQSEDRFWLSDRLRCRVEERICAKGRIGYCFDLPLQLIAKYLERKYFQGFLKSQLFQNYLNELKLKLRDANDLATCADFTTVASSSGVFRKSLHRKTLSDSSEGSRREVLKQNTLLAMDGNKVPQPRIKNIAQTSGSDLHIDSRQLTNPNLMWHRSYSSDGGALKFGHINELGRYERDFDAVDSVGSEIASGGKHNWSLNLSGNKIKNTMRKLVNLPEDKVQEEIAWQVAEMIVRDVTNVTLRSDQLNSNPQLKTNKNNHPRL